MLMFSRRASRRPRILEAADTVARCAVLLGLVLFVFGVSVAWIGGHGAEEVALTYGVGSKEYTDLSMWIRVGFGMCGAGIGAAGLGVIGMLLRR